MFQYMERKIRELFKNKNKQPNKRKYLTSIIIMMFILQLILPIGLVSATKGVDELQDSTTMEVQAETRSSEEAVKAAEEKAKLETEAKAAEAKANAESAAKEAEDKAKANAESAAKEAEDKAKAEEESAAKEAEDKAKAEEESAAKEAEDKAKAEEESAAKEAEDKAKANAESAAKEAEDKAKAEAEAKAKEEEGIEDPEESFIGNDGVDPSLIMGSAAISYFAKGSLGPNKQESRMSLAESKAGELAPGEVRTNKKATKVPGTVNTWDIEVLIEGRDDQKVETSDIVLVIDRSGSMSTGTRMQDAKNAANNFIKTMLDEYTGIRIAVVSFSSDYQGANAVDINSGFSDNKSLLQGKVNGLVPLGGTHTQAAILQGRALLDGSGADNKFMVLLSDGEPTFSYEPNNWETNTGTYKRGIYNGNFNVNNTVGTGNSIDRSYDNGRNSPAPRYRYINNGTAAIKQGEIARVGIDRVYTVATNTSSEGTNVLNQIASQGSAYSTQNSAELEQIYSQIAGEITTQYAINSGTVIDEMGDGFSLIDGSITTSQGTTTVAPYNDPNNQTITWTIPSEIKTLKEGTEDIRYAKMTYRVEINEDMASIATADGTDNNTKFKTNKSTVLNYKDKDKVDQEKSFTSPEVDPVLLKIKKILKDEAGNVVDQDARNFNVQITNGGSGFDQTPILSAGADYQILTTLRKEGSYNVEEISIDGEGITELDNFDITYDIDGNATTNFVVNHVNGVPRNDVIIEVTNQAVVRTIDFEFTKLDDAGKPLEGSEFTLEKQGEDTSLIDNSGTDPVFKFAALTEGAYILTETKAPDGYKLPTKNWTIEVVRNEETGLLEIQIPDDSFLKGDKDNGYSVDNEKQSEFPQTGGIGSFSYIAIGLVILMGSLGRYVRKSEN